MHSATILKDTPSSLRIRLQAPALTLSSGHISAIATEKVDTTDWSAVSGDISFSGECESVSEREWRMTFSIRNKGNDVELRFAYPYLFYHFDTLQRVRIFNPTFGGVLESSVLPIVQDYPGPATFCLTGAAGNKEMLATGLFNDDQRHVIIRHVPAGQDGQIRFICERVFVPGGATVNLPAQFIRIGDDWADAFAPYRAFARKAFPRRRERPKWLTEGNFTETRKAHCIAPFDPPPAAAGIWIFDDEGKPRTLEALKREVDEACADGVKTGYTPLFYQFGWWQSMADIRGLFMFDSVCGDYSEAHTLTRAIVDYIHSRGARTYLYTNFIAIGDESNTFRLNSGLLVRDAANFPVQNASYPMFMLCPGAPGAKQYWDRIVQFILKDMDADGIFLDQVAGGFPSCYCYDRGHRHEHPDCYGRDMLDLVDFIGSRAREIKPESLIAGELVLDSRSPLLDETHGVGYSHVTEKPPDKTEEQNFFKPPEYYIFTRYLTPQIYSSVNARARLMDGAAGSHGWPEWREHRAVFESSMVPCSTEPVSALAYFFGPKDGHAILAVRTLMDNCPVKVNIPKWVKVLEPLPPGITCDLQGALRMEAGVDPRYDLLKISEIQNCQS